MRNRIRWRTALLMAVLLVAGLMAGCNSSSSSGDSTTPNNNNPPPPGTQTPDPTVAPDTTDSDPLGVLGSFPYNGQFDADPGAVLIVFFDDVLDTATVTSSTFQVTDSGGSPISGTVSYNYSYNDAKAVTVLFFVPDGGFPVNDYVTVDLPDPGIEDDDANGIPGGYSFYFYTGTAYTGSGTTTPLVNFDGYSTASLPPGVECAGDCGVLSSFGDAGPVSGSAGYISSAETNADFTQQGLVSNTPALLDTTSVMTVHDVTTTAATLSLTYDFVSDEFPEFVNLGFNDLFMVVVVGPTGGVGRIIDSVDLVGASAVAGTFPGMPVDSSEGTQHSGRKSASLSIASVGTPFTVYFIVSDVGDSIYPTVVMMDNVNLSQ